MSKEYINLKSPAVAAANASSMRDTYQSNSFSGQSGGAQLSAEELSAFHVASRAVGAESQQHVGRCRT